MREKLNVIELSKVVQGEGKFTGVPSNLIRMTNCNLNCIWCDSKEASWNAGKGKFTREEIESFLDNQIKHMFITGGNPTDPRNIEDLKKIIQAGRAFKKFIYIEDNGTNFVPDLDLDYVSLSPKLSSSIPINTKYESRHRMLLDSTYSNVAKWNEFYNCQFKFVIANKQDLKEALKMIETLKLPKSKVYLMAEGTTDKELNRNRQFVLEQAIQLNVNYTDRLHIVVYGNKKGV